MHTNVYMPKSISILLAPKFQPLTPRFLAGNMYSPGFGHMMGATPYGGGLVPSNPHVAHALDAADGVMDGRCFGMPIAPPAHVGIPYTPPVMATAVPQQTIRTVDQWYQANPSVTPATSTRARSLSYAAAAPAHQVVLLSSLPNISVASLVTITHTVCASPKIFRGMHASCGFDRVPFFI